VARRRFVAPGAFYDFDTVLKALRKLKAPYPIKIKFIDKMDNDALGGCALEKIKGKDYLVIDLFRGMCEDTAVFILMHEWAHALSWVEQLELPDHGPEWGLAYSRIWRAVMGEKLHGY
jgi:hypothetical protein